MKKLFTILAIALCSTLAMAQTNQYFWAGGQFIMGNPIGQIDSVTFGELENTDSVLLYLPHTVKVIHDTVIQYVTIHDTINPCAVPDGAISGKFSVSPTKQVFFSQGNLQYNIQNMTWKFADNQYEFIGKDNVSNAQLVHRDANRPSWACEYYWQGDTIGSMIDLFAWSSDFDTDRQWGIKSSSDDNSMFGGNFVDWGINIDNYWYTMSGEEWNYLLTGRPNAANLIAVGTVNGVNGCIVLPDDWVTPNQINFTPEFANQIDSSSYSMINNFTIYQWQKMEKSGAVFLPACGDRSLTHNHVDWLNDRGAYWCSSKIDQQYGDNVNIKSNGVLVSYSNYYIGRSVRLVQEVK